MIKENVEGSVKILSAAFSLAGHVLI